MMKKMLCIVICLLVLMAAAGALAQTVSTYTFGGSGRDWLYDMASSDNGLIALTGWTESSDGTLASRTKTGRSGWLLVINREGKEIVNFCTRLGSHDNLSHPVFHEDGTLTVMLFAEDADLGWVKLELIRLGAGGDVLSRKVLMEKKAGEDFFISIAGHDERGYILSLKAYTDGGSYTHYFLFGYDGESKGQLADWHGLSAVADAHSIRRDEEQGDEAWLYRRDAQGNAVKQSAVFTRREDNLAPLTYNSLITLPDGGAAGAGWVLDENETEEERLGLFTRWDAEGNIVCEMCTPGVFFGDLTLTPGGFAATAYPIDDGKWFDYSTCTLFLFDSRGVMTGTILLGDMENIGPHAPVIAMGDGTIATVKVISDGNDDSAVMIIAP